MESMETKVLIALDLSENSLKAAHYVGNMVKCHNTVEISLMHVIREPSPDIMTDAKERQRHVETARADALALMEELGGRLAAFGIPPARIHLSIQVCRKPVSVAELILREQVKGGYGTVVVGRRGISKKEAFLFGSVSSTVVREARECAVWVIP